MVVVMGFTHGASSTLEWYWYPMALDNTQASTNKRIECRARMCVCVSSSSTICDYDYVNVMSE